MALLLLCGDGEERAEVYGCAADRNQAKIVFDVAVDMVRFCPALSKRVKILESQKKITYLPTNSSYQVLSADVANKHGFNNTRVIFDEMNTQPNESSLTLAQGSGSQISSLSFTTHLRETTPILAMSCIRKPWTLRKEEGRSHLLIHHLRCCDGEERLTRRSGRKTIHLSASGGPSTRSKAACESAKKKLARRRIRQLRLYSGVSSMSDDCRGQNGTLRFGFRENLEGVSYGGWITSPRTLRLLCGVPAAG